MNTKLYSNKQEKMIANYLGWSVVSGSGSRDFHPGDIVDDNWLGECKTHTTLLDKVVFYRTHWDKICKEATEYMRYPVLFADDGSQRIDHTLVMLSCLNFPDNCHTIAVPKVVKQGINIHVNLADFKLVYSEICKDYEDLNILINVPFIDGNAVYITTLECFKDMFNLEER